MNLKLTPQSSQIWGHLKRVGSISGVEAAALYKCRYLPRRVLDIKEQVHPKTHGVTIESVHKKDATGQRYVRYVLHDPYNELGLLKKAA